MSNSCEWPSRDDDERMTLVVAVGLLLGCTRGNVVQACTLDADIASSSSASVDILLMLARKEQLCDDSNVQIRPPSSRVASFRVV